MLELFAEMYLNCSERNRSYDVSAAGCPHDVLSTAAILASRDGDCDSCLQLTAQMAERGGMTPHQIHAVFTHDRDAMSDDVRLAYDFTRAVLARDGWDAPAREEIVRRFGKRALIVLSYRIAVAGLYRAFEYACGGAHSCARVSIGGFDVATV